MKVINTQIEGVLILEPRVFKDDRGVFSETFNANAFNNAVGYEVMFVQDNQSISKKHVLRGLHLQNPPFAQGKLVRVIKGSVVDVALDLRKDSATFGKSVKVELSEANGLQLWIPPGFAHGFLALEDDSIFAYKCTNFYAPDYEACIKWDDPDIGIDWGIEHPLVSEKDEAGEEFINFTSQF